VSKREGGLKRQGELKRRGDKEPRNGDLAVQDETRIEAFNASKVRGFGQVKE
jgi:hypothetical protein